jgi:hypothetical protein
MTVFLKNCYENLQEIWKAIWIALYGRWMEIVEKDQNGY